MILERELSNKVLRCAYTVHSELGPGLLEKTYEECLFYELKKVGLFVEKQKDQSLLYKDILIDVGYKMDLLVENKIILELKSVESLTNVHTAQLLTYLKLSHCKIGYLINFNVVSLKEGIKRYVL
ncbi:GxxExxY protein [Dysgonomonas macrotermitis]|uniref:GxxExxY protein n=1 Tax=Dysgonomonas macrotermitis TaxID=1346286 RepID=A0A1M5AK27_9BACT|nr:GxxExxY protein [Dysgonomonas macrotermitis]SHF30494.1 GxxExxY protein [Dysgonomonas macrotermitis]